MLAGAPVELDGVCPNLALWVGGELPTRLNLAAETRWLRSSSSGEVPMESAPLFFLDLAEAARRAS
jgi:hypothetical protein